MTGLCDDAANNKKLLYELSDKTDRSAAFVCAIACVLPDGREFCVEGRAECVILTTPSGENGFGYDPLFYYEPFGKTFADGKEDKLSEFQMHGLITLDEEKITLTERGFYLSNTILSDLL